MLEIHFANRFEALADQLVGRLGSSCGSVFRADQVVVPSAAIQRWLTLALARRHGICAQVRFAYLAEWLWRQIGRVVPGVAEQSPFDPSVLGWRVYEAFGDEPWRRPHPRLRAWLERADPVMRYELAMQVAGLIDQTITYRPDWLAAWSRGESVDLGRRDEDLRADHDWQAALWRRLSDAVGAAHTAPAAAFVRALEAGDSGTLAALPPVVHVFCVPAMPPLYLHLLRALGQCIEVQLYALNPCREYWFEVVGHRRLAALSARGQAAHHEVGNRLLASWGGQTQSQLSLLVEAVGDAAVDDAHYVDPAGRHLLACLQNSVLDMVELAPGSIARDKDDRSIEVHVCHSLARELEVLHDTLLALFAQPGAPAPDQVLVVTPDLDAAAPLIEAVFGTVPKDRFIPYAITGRARSGLNAPAGALLALLSLANSRMPASAVFGLLQQPVVARRFGLDADDLEQVRAWLRDAGVHWALDAGHRASLGLPAVERHSLADGLERLFLGYALPESAARTFDGRLPAGNATGSASLALGALASFVEALARLREQIATPRATDAWPGLLADALEAFVAPDEDEWEDLREVLEAIEELGRHWQRSQLEGRLPVDVVHAAIARALDDPARGGVPTGMVTFASMSSLRNLPFRVVCAIGLNDGAFPTAGQPAEFDLIAALPRRGDRQRRIDERTLFLDLLLAARERVHLSYVGRNVRDNSALPPSVLVSELLEVLIPAIADDPGDAKALSRARSCLVVEHPLQPFSPDAFRIDADPRRRSFRSEYVEALRRSLASPPPAVVQASATDAADDDAEDLADADAPDEEVVEPATPFFGAPLPPPGDEWRDVPLERLVRFLHNPSRALLEGRLGLELRRNEDELLDDEPFVPDLPRRNALAQRLLPHLLAGADLATARALAAAGTELPAGMLGDHFLERELAALQDFAARIAQSTREACVDPHPVAVEMLVEGEPWRLHVAFADLRPNGLVRYRCDELRARDHLEAWLHHLLLCADPPAGVQRATTWWGRDGALRFRPCDDPRVAIGTLLGLYARGLREPLGFFPKTAWAYVTRADSLSAATQAWRPSAQRPHAEGADAAHRLAWRGRPDPLVAGRAEFHACAHAVFDPLLAHLEPTP